MIPHYWGYSYYLLHLRQTTLSFRVSISSSVTWDWDFYVNLQCSKYLSSVQSLSVSLPLHGLKHTRLPCPSLTPGACTNSCPSSQWCYPTISSSAVPFSSYPHSCPALGSFPMNQFFASGGQSIGASASASVLPMNIQYWFPLGWNGWISLQLKGLKSLLQHHDSKKSVLQHSAFFIV